jgi:hypothetical protein
MAGNPPWSVVVGSQISKSRPAAIAVHGPPGLRVLPLCSSTARCIPRFWPAGPLLRCRPEGVPTRAQQQACHVTPVLLAWSRRVLRLIGGAEPPQGAKTAGKLRARSDTTPKAGPCWSRSTRMRVREGDSPIFAARKSGQSPSCLFTSPKRCPPRPSGRWALRSSRAPSRPWPAPSTRRSPPPASKHW